MKINVAAVAGNLASLTWVALRSFVGTLAGMVFLGVLLAAAAYYWLSEAPWYYGIGVILLTLAEAIGLGIFLGGKRAIALTLAHAFGSLRLGQWLVRLIFDRIVGVGAEEGDHGVIVKGLQRVPLARAEELLTGAVRSVMGEVQQGGWMRRTMNARLLEAIRKYTLARFRAEGAEHGGIDLLMVRDELEQTVDSALVERLRGAIRKSTILIVLALPLLVALQTWLAASLGRP